MRLLLVVLLFSCSLRSVADEIDSLKIQLDSCGQDSLRISIIMKMAKFSETEEAKNYLIQAMEICNRNLVENSPNTLFFKKQKAYVLMGLAINSAQYRQKDDLIKADNYYKLAYSIIKELDDNVALADYYSNSSLLFKHMGNFDEAIKRYYSALQIYEADTFLDEEEIYMFSCLLNNLGVLHHQQGNIEKALQYSLKAIKLGEKLKRGDQGMHIINTGAHYLKLGNIEQAEKMYFRGLTFLKTSNGTSREIVLAYERIGSLYSQKGNFEKAIYYLDLALELATRAGLISFQGSVHRNIALVLLKKKAFSKAQTHALIALQIAESSEIMEDIMNIEKVLSDIFKEKGHYKDALSHFQRYVILRDSVSNSKTRTLLESSRLNYEFEKKTFQDSLQIIALKEKNEKQLLQKQIELSNERKMRYAVISIAVMALVIIFLVFNRITLKARNKQKQLEISNLQASQFLLRAQMNPHFIFNSINSIYSVITGNRPKDAEKYLISFSRLMRSVLNHTSKNQITLAEEITALNDYIELERFRMNNKFSYHIEYGPEVSMETLIPPILLQPFVENAILHGLRHKDSEGQLTINFNVDGEILQCIIADDGIGRKKSAEINAKKALHTDSKGMQITTKRIEQTKVINKASGIEIIDLNDNDGRASGTKVIIKLPYSIA